MNIFGLNVTRERRPIKMAVPELKQAATVAPLNGGRSSQEETSTLFGTLFGEMNAIQPKFLVELLKLLEHLAMYNDDVSYAVDNIVQLTNTGWDITFDDGVSDEQAKVMIAEINEQNKYWYKGGLNSLINDLLCQLAINGCISAENIPNESLNDLKKVVLVPPHQIRFMYDKELDEYIPHQKLSGSYVDTIGQAGLVRLNEFTYKYYALRRFGSNPYAIPPFLSALEGVELDKDMVCNLRAIGQNLGTLGFLKVLLNQPAKKQGEDDAAYYNRLMAYQQLVAPELEKGFSKGLVVGFKGTHEMETQSTTTNAAGAKGLMDHVLQKKFAGLKQDALMLGRNFNVAQTMANVILAKLTSQSKNYQSTLASFIQDTIGLKLLLRGYKFKQVFLTFRESMIVDQLNKENAEGKKFDNNQKKYNQGLISQQDFALEMGLEKPDQEEPRMQYKPADRTAGDTQPAKGANNDQNKKKTSNVKFYRKPLDKKLVRSLLLEKEIGEHHIVDLFLYDGTKIRDVEVENYATALTIFDIDMSDVMAMDVHSISMFESRLGKEWPEFDYGLECTCTEHYGKGVERFASANDKMFKYLEGYYNETKGVFDKASSRVTKDIVNALRKAGNGATLEQVTDSVLYNLYKNWGTSFSEAQQRVIDKWIKVAYKEFKADTSIFGAKASEVPKATFGLRDTRTMKYFENSDSFYLGKFITDEDTKKRVTAFIKQEFEANGIPTGDNAGLADRFREKFEGVLDGESWKISRVVSTTMNKLKNYAAIDYMSQAGVTTFEIRGINDRLQCKYCGNMQGRRFSVLTALRKADTITSATPETISVDAPFITSVFKGAEGVSRLEGLSDAEVQSLGVDAPPFHSGCRDRAVAVL